MLLAAPAGSPTPDFQNWRAPDQSRKVMPA
jgi:hypothetical protein